MTEQEKTENNKKSDFSTGKKIAAGVLGGVILGGAGYAISKLLKSDEAKPEKKIPVPEKHRLDDAGKLMTGGSYIHRPDIERKLADCTINHSRSVNLAGMRKIGKSSLVYNVFESKTTEYYKKNIIVAKVLADISDSADRFFKNMMKALCEVIENESGFWGDCGEALQLNEKIQNESIEQDGYYTLCKFFEAIKNCGKRVICIVDEFYNSSELLKNYSGFFSVLKQFVTNHRNYDVTFVFVSETPVKELDFISDRLYLCGFSDAEMAEYYRCNEISGSSLSYEERAYLRYIAGSHPYWLDLVLKAYKEEKDSGRQLKSEEIFRSKAKLAYDEFEKTLDSLGENLKNKLYQIVFGPMDESCTQIDIDKLYDFGIIVDRENPKLISGGLHEYMRIKEKEVDFFPLWHETETGLRRILKTRMEKEYSEYWEHTVLCMYILKNPGNIMEILKDYFFPNDIPRKNPENYICQGKTYSKKQYQLSYDLKKAEELKKNMIKDQRYGTIKYDAEISILEALFTKSLFFLYEFEYEKLKLIEIFGDYDKFIKKAIHLSRARNTYQHNNGWLLTDKYKKKTTDCCKYLCECIRKAEM